jgi:transposase
VSTGDPFVRYPYEGTVELIVLGADTHKVSHTLAAVEEGTGRAIAERTVKAKRRSFDDLLRWGRGLGEERVWAIEDCRHVSGALERFLLARGERVMRVPPKLMAGARKSARERGKSDAIDAVAIARAAIREGLDTLPVAQLAGPERDVRLLVDHRERLVAQRTALINDLRWGLHDLWPEFEIPPRALIHASWQDRVAARLARAERVAQVRIARDELRRIRELTRAVDALERELAGLVAELAPRLLAERGRGVLTAAKLIGEIAGVDRFASDAKLARSCGSAPIPASSGQTRRHRLDRWRQPPAQLRAAPPRRQQRAPGPRNGRLPRPQAGRRQEPTRSTALPQAPPRPPRLAAAPDAAPARSHHDDHASHDHLHHALRALRLDIGATTACGGVSVRW